MGSAWFLGYCKLEFWGPEGGSRPKGLKIKPRSSCLLASSSRSTMQYHSKTCKSNQSNWTSPQSLITEWSQLTAANACFMLDIDAVWKLCWTRFRTEPWMPTLFDTVRPVQSQKTLGRGACGETGYCAWNIAKMTRLLGWTAQAERLTKYIHRNIYVYIYNIL